MEKQTGSRERIIEAAWQLFSDKGYEATTLEDILTMSQTSKGTFYYYFPGKDSLLATMSQYLDRYYKELEKRLDPEGDRLEQLIELTEKAHGKMERDLKLDLLTALYSTQLMSRGERHLLDEGRYYYRLATRLIQEGQTRGEITDQVPAEEIMHYYALCERGLVTDWCLHQGSYSLATYSRQTMPRMLFAFKKAGTAQ